MLVLYNIDGIWNPSVDFSNSWAICKSLSSLPFLVCICMPTGIPFLIFPTIITLIGCPGRAVVKVYEPMEWVYETFLLFIIYGLPVAWCMKAQSGETGVSQ